MKRLFILALLAGCGDPLEKDLGMFCDAVVGSNSKSFVELGPYLAERAKSEELKAILRDVPAGQISVWEIETQVRSWMATYGRTECRTLGVIVPRRPDDHVVR